MIKQFKCYIIVKSSQRTTLVPLLLTVVTAFVLISFFHSTTAYSQNKPSLKSLQKQYRQTQAKNDLPALTKILRKMLDSGYKSVERYKTLGDLYFYLKKEQEALDTFREQAKWANTAKTWENLSDLLIWKGYNNEGIAALEKATKLSKGEQRLVEKLAGKYEYNKEVKKSEQLWVRLYQVNKKSLPAGKKLIDFYLRNGKVKEAREVLDELYFKDSDLGNNVELKILDVKISSWLSKPDQAFHALKRLKIDEIPEKDLEYSFDLALFGGNAAYAEEILNRLKKLGKNIWEKQLKLIIAQGDPEKIRKAVLDEIDEKGESVELLKALYETYRSQRDTENQIEVLEDLVALDYKNLYWIELLTKLYIYDRKLEQGIDTFEDIADDHKDAQLITLSLAWLYLQNQEYEDFYETVEKVDQEDLQKWARDMKLEAAYRQDDPEKTMAAIQDALKHTENIAPEDKFKRDQLKSGKKKTDDTELPYDQYFSYLRDLSYLAGRLGRIEEKESYGREAYLLLKNRFQQYPTDKRLRDLLSLGEQYAQKTEKTEDFEIAKKKFDDTDFYLRHYRFLMKDGNFEEAEKVLIKLLASPKSIEESIQAAEHTFGFVSYNLSKKLFLNIIAKDPNYTMGLKRLGQIALYTEAYQEAAFYFEKYLSVNSYDPEAIFDLAEAQYFNHQPFDAIKKFEQVIDLLDYPGRENYETLLVAISYLRLKKYETALDLLIKVHKKDPKDLSIKLNILETLVLLERWQEALDLIERENLDDETRKKKARELIFRSNLETVVSKEDREVKSSLKFEELKAIVDVQLALRVNIIMHLCYEGLGRLEEDRILLDQLARKHPGNKDLLATIGYVYLEKGDDFQAIYYLKKAKDIPPNAPIINQTVRELTHNYSAHPYIKGGYLEKHNDGQKEYQETRLKIGAQMMVTELDRLTYEISLFSSKRFAVESSGTAKDPSGDIYSTTTSQPGSVSKASLDLAYKGVIEYQHNLPFSHGYEVHLHLLDLIGYEFKYGLKYQQPSISFGFNWFNQKPDHDDFERTEWETYHSGYGFNGGFLWKKLRQNYYFSYISREYQFENPNIQGQPGQQQTSISLSQQLLKYPNTLSITLAYLSSDSQGEVREYSPGTNTIAYKHFSVPYTQLNTELIFARNWSELLKTSFSLSRTSGNYQSFITEHKSVSDQSVTGETIKAELNYRSDRWQFSAFLKQHKEKQDEKTEISIINLEEKEFVADAKTILIPEFGFTAQYRF